MSLTEFVLTLDFFLISLTCYQWNQPDWYYLLSSLDRHGGEMFWVAENEICHVDQAHLIETADIF